MTATCPTCGRRFERAHGNQVYCGLDCAVAAKRERQRAYYERTRAERLSYSRDYRAEEAEELDEFAARAVDAISPEKREWLKDAIQRGCSL